MRAEPRKKRLSDNKGRERTSRRRSRMNPWLSMRTPAAAFAFELIPSLILRGSVILEAGVRDCHEMFAVGETIIFTMPERQRA